MLVWILGCQSAPTLGTVTTPPDEELPLVDTAPPEQIPGAKGSSPCPGLYDQDEVMDFHVQVTDEVWNQIAQDFAGGRKTYREAEFTWGEETVSAQIRLKGNPNFSWFGGKKQFVISFNEDDPDARFHGVRKIALDAAWYEPTMMRDRLAWQLIRDNGDMPHACANAATLTVNGEYYGLFTSIEYFDHEWVERNFGDSWADGTLWKYGQEAKTNEAQSDSTVVNRYFRETDVDELAELGDPEQWVRAWAVEAAVGSDDGYWCCEHNFYIYEHPEDGLVFIPWDLDLTFDILAYDAHPISGTGNGYFNGEQFRAVVESDEYADAYVDAIEEMADMLAPDAAEAYLDAWEPQVATLYADDPTRSTGVEEHEQSLEKLRAWIPQRQAYLRSWVACERGESDGDGDGYGPCEDKNDGDASVHPGAVETCNGIDDDADGAIDELASCDDCERHDFEGLHLLFCERERTWDESQALCEERGGTLAQPNDTAGIYMTYLHTWNLGDEWWLGAHLVGGSWVDADGQAASGYWVSGEPNNTDSQKCAAWDTAYWGWRSEDCAEEKPAICVLL
ncbi:MAG: hypothetical protein GY913_12340 [Proteobacteria bacterium]|nr:hypothetical protein [Pseudomonadota bacterium]MCP4917705.1 hypothetical protein [Pseudomonadota bacterium]